MEPPGDDAQPLTTDARTAMLSSLLEDEAMLFHEGSPHAASPNPTATVRLSDALATHRGHQSGPRRWLLRRFVVYIADLPALLEGLDEEDVLDVGVALGAAPTGADLGLLDGLAQDPRAIVRVVEASEVPDAPGTEIPALLDALAGRGLACAPGDGSTLAVEVRLAGRPAGEVLDVLEAIAAARADGHEVIAALNAGDEGDGVSSDIEVAGFLLASVELGVPFKAASGLQRPLRTDPGRQADAIVEHGYVNAVAGLAIAKRSGDLDAVLAQVRAPGASCTLTAEMLVLGDTEVGGSELAGIRRDHLRAVGCADVFEAVNDLAQMRVILPTGGLT